MDPQANLPKEARGFHRKGVTLIELVIVIALLAVVGFAAIPSFQRLVTNGRLKSAARDMASDFAALKERTVAGNRLHRIVIDTGSWDRYTLQQCNHQGSPCGGWMVMETKNLSVFGNDLVVDPPPATTVASYFFQTRGTCTSGTIVLRNRRNSKAVMKANLTGRITVQFIMQ